MKDLARITATMAHRFFWSSPAVTRSGITGARARMIASAFGGQRWFPKVVAAG